MVINSVPDKFHSIPAESIAELLAHMVVSVLATGCYMALAFPVMFVMQNITVAFLIYMLLASGAINKIIGYLAMTKYLKKLNIENFTMTNCINVFRSRMILGSFQFESVLGIAIYLGAALWLANFIYSKRELDF